MKEALITSILFIFLVCVCVCFSVAVDKTQCKATGGALGYKTEWHFFTGCIVTKPDGNKVLLKQMRDMEK